MKRISLLVLMAALVSFVAVSCKKYEEGPAFSLASKKGRVANDWKIEKSTYFEDGSSTDDTDDFTGWSKIEFTKDGDFTIEAYGDTYPGTWKFDDKKENLIINIDGGTWTWEILRLKKNELWVKWVYSADFPDQYSQLEFVTR